MSSASRFRTSLRCLLAGSLLLIALPAMAGLVDRNTATSTTNDGIAKTYAEQIGAGRGDDMTPDTSVFNIERDPFRAIRRGRQLFQRKFTRAQGQGPVRGDGAGDINTELAIGAGLSDSCSSCHGRPRGSAGFGGDVVTRPDGRDAQHLFGLGLKEMLADEITRDLRVIRDAAVADAAARGRDVQRPLASKGIAFGYITARPDGTVDTSKVDGVAPDLRVRPFFSHGGTISIREFIVGGLDGEMGLNAPDTDLITASSGGVVTTPAGMVLDGSKDTIETPRARTVTDDPDHDGVVNEVPVSIVDYLEFYLLNYFKPGTYESTPQTEHGRRLMEDSGCMTCHVPDLLIERDRRVADVETVFDPSKGIFNRMFATATTLYNEVDDGSGFWPKLTPKHDSFLVRNIFTDFKRHDLGPAFRERNYDGTSCEWFLTTPLWGVGSTAPYGHDGRSINLREVILRHGGDAQDSRDAYAHMSETQQQLVVDFLNTLVVFPPDDTASNVDPGDPSTPGFPQRGHGSIKLSVLYCEPTDPE